MILDPDPLTDKQAALSALFCAGLSGDRASYARFLQQVSGIMRKLVARKLPAADVEDVVQDILVSIHKARHTYDGQRPILPWLYAISRFRIQDHLRRLYAHARFVTLDIETMADVLPDVTKGPAASELMGESLEDMLKHVPDRERRILTMMHQDGYTAKETGTQLGMKESAVKVAAFRALKKIREKLGL